MSEVITYVGIDAHKKDLFIAMLIGREARPVTWQPTITIAGTPTSA